MLNHRSYEEEIVEWLEIHLKDKTPRTEIIIMTPFLANYILDNHHPQQRKLRERHVNKLAEDMKTKKWEYTGEPFQFSVVGDLLNGQHRLHACIKSKVSFKSAIAFGVPESARNVMDTGYKRSNADALMLHGVKTSPNVFAGALRWMAILNKEIHRGKVLTNPEIINLWERVKNKSLMKQYCNRVTEMSRRKNQPSHLKGKKVPVQILLAVFYKASVIDANEADSFIAAITDQSSRSLGSKLIKQLDTLPSGREKELTKMAIVIKAWNFFKKGKSISINDLHWSPVDDIFPKMEG